MSRTQKIVLVALAVLALGFVALLLWGGTQPPCRGTPLECAQSYKPGSAMRALGRLFPGGGTKIKLTRKRYELGSANASVRVDIDARTDKSEELRTLTLRQVRGAFDLNLVNIAKDPDLDEQESKNPHQLPRDASDPQDARTLSFAVTHHGAQLTITCRAAPCVLETD